jgi:hypothetical protein
MDQDPVTTTPFLSTPLTEIAYVQPQSLAAPRQASPENAYAVAVQLRAAGGTEQFVVSTGDPMQPFRVSGEPPIGQERFLALVA